MIETKNYITEKDLVDVIQAKGFTEVNQRLFGEWRRRGLLPKFDKIGKGLGKGAGRIESAWVEPEIIVMQALRILQLRKFYRNYNDMHFSLWVLGGRISHKRVFYSLCQPLNFLRKDLIAAIKRFRATDGSSRSDDGGYIEDYISEAAANYVTLENSKDMPKRYAEAASLEIGMNLIFNPSYQISHEDIEIINSELRESGEVDEENNLTNSITDDTLNMLARHSQFIQQNFSLQSFRLVMNRCTRKDLEETRIDLNAASDLISVVAELTNIYMKDVRQDLKPESMDIFLPLILSAAKLFVWIDLSLRHAGYGEYINHFRGKLPNLITDLSSADIKTEIAKSSAEYAVKAEKRAIEIEEIFDNDPVIKRFRKKNENKEEN